MRVLPCHLMPTKTLRIYEENHVPNLKDINSPHNARRLLFLVFLQFVDTIQTVLSIAS